MKTEYNIKPFAFNMNDNYEIHSEVFLTAINGNWLALVTSHLLQKSSMILQTNTQYNKLDVFYICRYLSSWIKCQKRDKDTESHETIYNSHINFWLDCG